MIRFRRMMFPCVPAVITRPLVLPVIELCSMTLSFALRSPMPKLFPWAVYPFPLSRFPRSRLRLAPPNSHMPPHGATGFPLRTETLLLISCPDPPPTRTPEKQFVDSVMPVTVTPVLWKTNTPGPRNC